MILMSSEVEFKGREVSKEEDDELWDKNGYLPNLKGIEESEFVNGGYGAEEEEEGEGEDDETASFRLGGIHGTF